MKRTNPVLAIAIVATLVFSSPFAAAADPECSPQCELLDSDSASFETITPQDGHVDSVEPAGNPACTGGAIAAAVEKAEKINDRIKPIRQIVNYVRTPQGLVIKLVNDHILKIPPWIGFAMDPVGTLKHRAIDEAKDWGTHYARETFGLNRSNAVSCPQGAPAAPSDAYTL
jgi:hypothetical protein